ncbi:MAG TPA: AMIN domain-containing protein [Blastocatellia bacterium]|nr:AMIN domain-containing protein [Blastocatellia bacterium]
MHSPLRMRAYGYPHPHLWSLAGRLMGLLLLMLLVEPRTLAASDAKGNQPGRLPPATRVLDVHAETAGNLVRLVIRADGLMVFRPFTLPNPWRIVIDITGVRNAVSTPTIPVTSALVSRIRVGQPEADVVRVVIDMLAMIPYRVDLDSDRLVISVGQATPGPNGMRPPPPAVAPTTVMAHGNEPKASPPVADSNRRATSEQSQRPDNGSEDRTTVNRLLRRVDELEARVHELEGKQAVAVATPATPVTEKVTAAPAAPPPQESGVNHNGHNDHNDHDVPSGRPSLQLQGFADVDYRATSQRGVNNTFALGQLDLFITSRLSDKFNVLSELIVQAGLDNSFSFEVHRLLLQYYPNDYFNLSIGRYHTSIGYYNSAYHHGQWFQTAATRPFIFAFEGQGGILPLHNVGLSLSGRIPSGSLGLRYMAEVGNGRSVNSPGDRAVQTTNDENEGKAFNLGVLMRPDWARGLQAGFSVYRDQLTPTGRARVDQTIMAAHVIFRNSDYEWLNEALLLRHAPAGGARVFDSPAFYTQVARRFGDVWPYFRYEYLNVPDDDPIFPTIGRRNGPLAGLRYDLTEFAAFKVQYGHTQRRRQKSLDELLLQMAFTF